MKLRRALSAAALAVLAATGLSACQTKVGQAASIGDQSLSDSELSSYVTPGAQSYTVQGDSGVTTVVPKLFVLEIWLQEHAFERAAVAAGGPITTAERNGVVSYLDKQGETLASYRSGVAKRGYETKTGDLLLQQRVALFVLVERLAHTTNVDTAVSALQQAGSAIVRAVENTKPNVHVSRRYGTWDATSLSLSTDSTAGLPGFVLDGSTASATTG